MKALLFSDKEDILMQMATMFRTKFDIDLLTFSENPDISHFGAKKQINLKVCYAADALANYVISLINKENYDYFLAGSTAIGRELAAMVAETMGFDMISEILSMDLADSKVTTTRFFYGGKTIITEQSKARVFTVMPGLVDPAPASSTSEIVKIENVPETKLKIEAVTPKQKGSVNIEKADILVSVGRGIGKKEGIELARSLASVVHGEVSGSRPICLDYHWLEEERQVGLSGKRVKPRLYIALGISGQIQHIAGMRGSKMVIAVNKDKNAPIFSECDYGMVGDLYQVVPALIELLKK
ncbi:MAG: electron transfer flavoprotein subunit alpha/FixB family protein [Thermoplasmata archaeon]